MGSDVSVNIVYGIKIPLGLDLEEDDASSMGLEMYFCGCFDENSEYIVYIPESCLGSLEDNFSFDPAALKVEPAWHSLLKTFCDDNNIPFEPKWYACGYYG
jgi:hypothetical protein